MSTSSLNSNNLPLEMTVGFPVFITNEQYRQAQEQAQKHKLPAKQQRVLHHTLAVLAVEDYCQNMGVFTNSRASHSFDLTEQTTNDVADLVLPGLGRLECRAIGEVCPFWSDGLGVVVVRWEESTQIIHLLGFISHLDLESDKPITVVAPLDQLFDRIAQVELGQMRLEAEDSVNKRVKAGLQGRSWTELVLTLERVLQEASPRVREYKLKQYLLGLNDSEFGETESDLAIASMLNIVDADNSPSELERECIELAEDLLDLFEDWQEEANLSPGEFIKSGILEVSMLDNFHAMTLHAITEAIRNSDSIPDELVSQIHDVAQDLLTNLSDSNDCSSLYDLVEKIRDTPGAKELSVRYEQEFELLIDLQNELQRGPNQTSSQSNLDYLKRVLANCQFLKNYQSISNS